MSGAQSISTRRAYGVQRVCRVWHRARSSVYARRQATRSPAPCRRRGPIGAAPDDVLVAHIRRVLEASPFHGEGYRKAWAKLRVDGIRTSQERVRRLMLARYNCSVYFDVAHVVDEQRINDTRGRIHRAVCHHREGFAGRRPKPCRRVRPKRIESDQHSPGMDEGVFRRDSTPTDPLPFPDQETVEVGMATELEIGLPLPRVPRRLAPASQSRDWPTRLEGSRSLLQRWKPRPSSRRFEHSPCLITSSLRQAIPTGQWTS